jgi:hypothetical protein
MAEETKRFTVGKPGKDQEGLVLIADASGNSRQATAYTRDGDTLRFSLEGDGGAFYSCRRGDPEFDELAEAFGFPDEEPEKEEKAPVKPAPKPDPKPVSA